MLVSGLGVRRWVVAGLADRSAHDVAHDIAGETISALESGGVRPFLVDYDETSLHFGLDAADRETAFSSLARLMKDPACYLEWRRGNRVRRMLLSRGRAPRSLLEAESWRVFRLHAVADDAVIGFLEAAQISFWALGAQQRLERIGFRGLHRFSVDAADTVEVVEGREYPGRSSFPVGAALHRFKEPIDAVYTWVDGDDPTWRAAFELWAAREGRAEATEVSLHPGRYRSHDELRYSLRSLWLNAGWIRRIYVVTADQVPSWLRTDDRLTVVSHKDILPSDALPTFNSHAIEASLHRIDGLAEHFVYLNDDLFLGRPLRPTTFFTANGLMRYVESEARVSPGPALPTDLAVDSAARNARDLIAERFGSAIERKLDHAPHSLRRSLMAEVEEAFEEQVTATIHHRFRDTADLSVASGLTQHFGFCTGRALPGDMRVLYQNLESGRLDVTLRRLGLGRDFDVFCINETEEEHADRGANEARLAGFLESYLPIPSPWESGPET